jgi:hypothetical protein
MRVREYPGVLDWPPTPGGACQGSEPFQLDDSKVVIVEVFPVENDFVTFTCSDTERPNSLPSSYDLPTQDQETAEQLAFWLEKLKGKTLDKFGEFPLDL